MRLFADKTLLVATHNAGKLEEMRALFAPHGITLVGAADYDLPEPAETEETFIGNARIKARAAMQATGLPALADDSGLSVAALDGAPGVHTADWAETPQGRDFMQAMTRVHEELTARGAPEPHRATFHATFLLVWPDGHEEIFEGKAHGRITWPPRGQHGHGYDPIFIPEGETRAYAEMSAEEKNRISHRADAFRQLEALFA